MKKIIVQQQHRVRTRKVSPKNLSNESVSAHQKSSKPKDSSLASSIPRISRSGGWLKPSGSRTVPRAKELTWPPRSEVRIFFPLHPARLSTPTATQKTSSPLAITSRDAREHRCRRSTLRARAAPAFHWPHKIAPHFMPQIFNRFAVTPSPSPTIAHSRAATGAAGSKLCAVLYKLLAPRHQCTATYYRRRVIIRE